MIITNKTLPRRTFLRGLGTAIALPMLDSMIPTALAQSAARKPAIRLGYIYTPNGIVGCSDKSPKPFMWTPKTVGANFEFSPTIKALEPFRDHVNVISGLAQNTGNALGDGPGDHARATATFLTGVHPYKTGGANYKLGISADQIAAKEFGKQTQLASLELGLEPQPLAGNCDSGYTCAYMSMSWRSETSPLPAEINPRAVFERLFGDGESTEPAARAARFESQRSVLDYVTSTLSHLQNTLGIGDKRKLDEYLESVRDIERRIQRAEEQNVTMQLPHMERPSSIPDDYEQYSKLMMDLQIMAWQTDMTRVASFTMGRDGSNRAYREIGISDGHHSISHHQSDPERVEKLIKIDELHVGLFAYFMKKLHDTQDGDGTLLDHSLVVFGSSLSESNIHTHDDLPIILAGNANGQVKGNRHLLYPSDTPLNNLFLNMFDVAGVPHVAGFGDSTGRLTDL
ncbi:MAG TPA: DUF1552 domain-containing protein [Vicinamibacterales bacterium]|nr:DUF1552 domain-containing protein [Vicinamibacterales bacterium]